MAAFCRICNDQTGKSDSDVFVSCNNCGSLACRKHYYFYPRSKNAFCTVCYIVQATQALGSAADAVAAVQEDGPAAELFRGILSEELSKFPGMTIDDLVALLDAVKRELARRDPTLATDADDN